MCDTIIELEDKHKQEKKELRNKIQNLKNEVSKNDKKARKQLNVEIVVLETELERKHDAELKLLQVHRNDGNSTDEVCVESCTDDADIIKEPSKLSKAQKRRNQKEKLERERNIRIKQAEEDSLLGPRHIEIEALREKLRNKQLSVFQIPSDGQCLFKSISHQLVQTGTQMEANELRTLVVEEMSSHSGDYLPFICETDDQFQEYLERMLLPSEWGGHTEIAALSKALQMRIEIMQYDSDNVCIGDYPEALTIVYYKHSFGLGEHYNSCVSVAIQ